MTKEFKPAQAFTDKPRPPIALVPVTSNQVKAIGYDEATQTLAVAFTRGTGAIYHYPNVPNACEIPPLRRKSCQRFLSNSPAMAHPFHRW